MPEENNPAGAHSKIPMPLLLIGGGVVVLVLLLKGGGSGSTSGGTDAAAIADSLAEQKATFSEQLATQRENFDERLKLAEGNSTAAANAATNNAVTNAEQQGVLAQILEKLKILAAPPPATNPPAGPTTPAAPLGPKPSDNEIKDWAHGIGLPESWGFGFVGRYGILPRNIPELESWRAAIGTFNGSKWCIAGECVG